MILLGIVLLVLGWLLGLSLLTWLGVIALVIGLVFALAGFSGHGVGGRRHWW